MRLFSAVLLLLAACGADPSYSATIKIKVPPTKPDGRPWDFSISQSGNAAPDITFCWVDPADQKKAEHCIDREAVNRRSCNNTTECSIPHVSIPDKELFFYIIDLDLAEHDAIGQGLCKAGPPCEFGKTIVEIVKDTP